MPDLPFCVFKRKRSKFYYVKFKNSEGGYLPAQSTKQIDKSLAIEISFKWFREGKPVTGGGRITPSTQDMLRAVKTAAEADYICKELKRRGFLKAYIAAGTEQALDFPDFLKDFWDYGSSPYIKEKLRRNHGIHKNYTIGQKQAVEKFWKPFFEGRSIGEITRKDIEQFMDSLDILANNDLPEKKKAKGEVKLSAGRKNIIIKAGTIPLRWAFSKEMIEKDITVGITWFSGEAAKRQILTPEIVQAVFKVEWSDARSMLANLLAAVTGLRSGEVRGLRVQDLGRDCVYVRHSWNRRDGLKTTKNNEARVVEVPFPSLINGLFNLAELNPHKASMDSYVFWAEKTPSKPMEDRLLLGGLRGALEKVGMSGKTAADYVFHGWRHFFTSYMLPKLDKKLLKTQTGHKTDIMVNLYGGHRLEGEREQIRKAQQEVFGDIVQVKNLIQTGP